MASRRLSVRRCFVCVLLTLTVGERESGALLIDDFSDGDDVGWSNFDNLTAGGPATFDPSSGQYRLASTTSVSNDTESISVMWAASFSGPGFENGFLRVRARAENSSSNVSLVMRGTVANFAGYSFAVNNDLNLLVITRSENFVDTLLALQAFPFQEGVDYFLEAGAVGADLSLKVWEASSAEPALPQLIVTDTVLTNGGISFSTYHWGSPAILAATLDDVMFIPEPSTALLLASGLGVLAARRRV